MTEDNLAVLFYEKRTEITGWRATMAILTVYIAIGIAFAVISGHTDTWIGALIAIAAWPFYVAAYLMIITFVTAIVAIPAVLLFSGGGSEDEEAEEKIKPNREVS